MRIKRHLRGLMGVSLNALASCKTVLLSNAKKTPESLLFSVCSPCVPESSSFLPGLSMFEFCEMDYFWL